LKKGRVPENEISIIVHNLVDLEKAGVKKGDLIGIIVHNIVKDSSFKRKFMNDPKGACRLVGINPVPTP
jgi:hypothetical protein